MPVPDSLGVNLLDDNLPPQSQLLLKRYSGNCGVDTTMNTISSSAIPRTSSARRSKKSGEELRLDHERPNSKRSENHQKHLVEEERIHHSRLSKLRMREIEIERRQRMARLKHKGDGSRQSSRGFQPQSGDKSHHDDVSHLIGHYSVQQNQYRCSVCSKEYKYEGSLLTHMETHKEENFLRCTFCQKDFSSMSSLNNHKRTHSAHCKKKPFKCTICDKEFYQKSSFEGHMRLHTGRRSRGFQPKPGYKSHDDDVSHCTEHFSSSSELDSQMDPSEGEGLMGEYCPPNNVTPVQEHIVERDMEAAASSVLMVTGTTTVGELEMNDDGKMTSSLDVAESSKLLSISMQQKQLRCSVCSKEYKYEGSLLTHMKAHKDENVTPVQELNVKRDVEEARSSVLMLTGTDTECELERNDDSEMTSSLGSAESSEPSPLSTQQEQYRCSVCSKEYKYKRSLLTHIETHKEENFLRCTLCQKDFSNMSSLNKHKRTHSAHCKTKPFKCTICDKEFYEKSSLDIHMRLHTGDKPHRCTMCDMKFPHYTSLTRHVFVVHHT